MPRAGLDPAAVVVAGAELADEVGLAGLSMGLLAERLGVRTPSLYKHVDGLADLRRRIALLAFTEVGDRVRDALQGQSGFSALEALARAIRDYVVAHPGRYAATVGAGDRQDADDPLSVAGRRVIDSMAVVLRGYDVKPVDMNHALRTLRSLLHGFATLQVSNGFQWDAEESFTWLIAFTDRGLRGV